MCCGVCNYFRIRRINRQVNRFRCKELRRSGNTHKLNVAEEMELQAIPEEEVIGPYAISETEGNAHYL